jgi:hypothetical protein
MLMYRNERKRVPTTPEIMARNAEKRQRLLEAKRICRQDGWRRVEQSKEAFVLDALPPEEAFLSYNIRTNKSLLTIFRIFLSDEVVKMVMDNWSPDDLRLGGDTRAGSPRSVTAKVKYVWQALAFYVKLVGDQRESKQNNTITNPLRTFVMDIYPRFRAMACKDGDIAGRDVIMKMIAIFLIEQEPVVQKINENFHSVVRKLGQSVAGDEKLYHFTGNSCDVRLVASKPDRIGLWFYELCAPLKCGLQYMLYTRLHTNRDRCPIKVAAVVQDWATIIQKFGPTSSKCILAFDNYYMDSAARVLLKEMNVKFTASCQPGRFVDEIKLLHNGVADEEGEWSSIYNENTKELLTYHWDTQKGVGKKYNLTWGLERTEEKTKIRSNVNLIPGYELYKATFETCDHFNKALHQRTYCHRRGGKCSNGRDGTTHDFILGCILQNTFSLYQDIFGRNGSKTVFQEYCDTLADEIMLFSLNTEF